MADAVGLLITIGEILNTLYEYGKAVSGAQQDIKDLTTELLVLQGVLQQIKDRRHDKKATPPVYPSQDPKHVLKLAERSLNTLLRKLEVPESGFKKMIKLAKWPLDKSDVAEQLTRFERLKSLLILVFLTQSSGAITEAIESLNHDVSRDLSRIESLLTRQRDAELIKWLAPVSPEERHARFCAEREPETRKWFLDKAFKTWMFADDRSMMCLTGKTGTGKTTLFSFAVDELRKESRGTWLYGFWYCSFTEAASQQPVNALGSLLSQFSRRDPTFLDEVRPTYENRQHSSFKKQMDLADLEEIMVQRLRACDRVFILIDAINESQENGGGLLSSLYRLMDRCNNVRLLVSTIGEIPRDDRADYHITTVRLQPQGSQHDLTVMVENALANQPGLRDLSDKLKQDVKRSFVLQADGSFRWASLALGNLARQNTPRQVREALKRLPTTLEETYTDILRKVPNKDKYLARRALLWLTFAQRPMTLAELNEAVVIEFGQSDIDEDDRLCRKELILDLCRGLIDCFSGVASLAHSSVATFLTSPNPLSDELKMFKVTREEGEWILMRKCLSYLSMASFSPGYCNSHKELKARLKQYPLLPYAAENWALHANKCAITPKDSANILSFLQTYHSPRGGNYSSWAQALLPKTDIADLKALTTTPPLYYAASFGLASVVKLILEEDRGVDVDAKGGRNGSTALFVACWREHYDVARLLLGAGADASLRDKSTGLTPRALLVRRQERSEVAKRLLWDLENNTIVKAPRVVPKFG